ncbi:hypothetical protein ACFSCX_13685 [Bacillus salitolerans]|uniref:Lipoprotein n=1 Tax=Bacillus salitolerans TaxID=1437434 RepID=A0ABW4LRB7_9BACI
MQRLLTLLVISFQILLITGCNLPEDIPKTIEEAIGELPVSYDEILHKVVYKDVTIVFINFIPDSNVVGLNSEMKLSVVFLKGNNNTGWEVIHQEHALDGGQQTIGDSRLPFDEGPPKDGAITEYIVFGTIHNPEISDIKIRTRLGSFEDGSFSDAIIIRTDWKPIYFLVRSPSTRTEVIGFDSSGKEIAHLG